MSWDGVERRNSDGVRDELRQVRSGMSELAHALARYPSREEVDIQVSEVRKEQVTWFHRFVILVALLLMSSVLNLWAVNGHRAQAEDRLRLIQTIEQYSEESARNSAQSHAALANNLSCLSDYFAASSVALQAGQPMPDKGILDACFEPTAPAPPSNIEERRNGRKAS